MYGWTYFKVNGTENGKFKIIEGKFERPLYKPPARKPPINEKKVVKLESKISFVIEMVEYDEDLLKECLIVKKQKFDKKKY